MSIAIMVNEKFRERIPAWQVCVCVSVCVCAHAHLFIHTHIDSMTHDAYVPFVSVCMCVLFQYRKLSSSSHPRWGRVGNIF